MRIRSPCSITEGLWRLDRHDELLALDGYYASLYQKQQLEEELTVAG